MNITTNTIDRSGSITSVSVQIDNEPDHCPICHAGITPHRVFAWYDKNKGFISGASGKTLQLVYRCPRQSCRNLFIAEYTPTSSGLTSFTFVRSVPKTITSHDFGEKINSISGQFQEVYNQASAAESEDLDQVCGPGYRKALEFLVKDYLIYLDPDSAETIKQEFLGKSIKDRVTSHTIKTVSERAAWLGNDESHYTRRWEDRDLNDLKNLIKATVHWIEQEELVKDMLAEMPETNPSDDSGNSTQSTDN